MEKSNTIENPKEPEHGEEMERQLDIIQRIAGDMQQHLAEARTAKAVHERSASSFQYRQYEDCMVEASICAERLTERLRGAVLGTVHNTASHEVYLKKLLQTHEIKVGYEQGILKAELSFLIPHRKNKYTDYLYKPFYLALEDWCRIQESAGREVPYYECATVCFVHLYDRTRSRSRVRDHDNMEEKQVLDALGIFFLSSDGGLYLNTYHTSLLGERDRTLLFLMTQEQFPEWIGETVSRQGISKNDK